MQTKSGQSNNFLMSTSKHLSWKWLLSTFGREEHFYYILFVAVYDRSHLLFLFAWVAISSLWDILNNSSSNKDREMNASPCSLTRTHTQRNESLVTIIASVITVIHEEDIVLLISHFILACTFAFCLFTLSYYDDWTGGERCS